MGTGDVPSPRGGEGKGEGEGEGKALLQFDDVRAHQVDEVYAAQVDTAFEMMFASEVGEEAVLVCLTTIGKILGNVVNQPLEEKFRKVKLNNKAMREKILSVSGGLEVLITAGFSQAVGEGDEGDILLHFKTRENQLRVTYVNQRLLELL